MADDDMDGERPAANGGISSEGLAPDSRWRVGVDTQRVWPPLLYAWAHHTLPLCLMPS